MNRLQTMRRIILPQAMRVIIPPTGNETIGMLKTTSLVSVITVAELLYSAQIIYARNFEMIPLLMVASIWYLVRHHRADRSGSTTWSGTSPRAATAQPAADSDGSDSNASHAGTTATRAAAKTCDDAEAAERGTFERADDQGRAVRTRATDGWRSSRASTWRWRRGEVLCIIGPSGSGKSTFLRCINHLERINAGRL